MSKISPVQCIDSPGTSQFPEAGMLIEYFSAYTSKGSVDVVANNDIRSTSDVVAEPQIVAIERSNMVSISIIFALGVS